MGDNDEVTVNGTDLDGNVTDATDTNETSFDVDAFGNATNTSSDAGFNPDLFATTTSRMEGDDGNATTTTSAAAASVDATSAASTEEDDEDEDSEDPETSMTSTTSNRRRYLEEVLE